MMHWSSHLDCRCSGVLLACLCSCPEGLCVTDKPVLFYTVLPTRYDNVCVFSAWVGWT
jgi:hypothetical protein